MPTIKEIARPNQGQAHGNLILQKAKSANDFHSDLLRANNC